MDDMKRLVERYKRELMEYSRQSRAKEPPKERLEFPEMTEDSSSPAESAYEAPGIASEAVEEAPAAIEEEACIAEEDAPRAPEIIGYSDNRDLLSAFSDMFKPLAQPELPLPDPNEPPQIDLPAGDTAPVQDNIITEDSAASAEEIGGVSTVTPEAAEEIGDLPESGKFPDEQLGNRDFEEQVPVINSRDDIQPLVQSGEAPPVTEERVYSSLQEFVDVNNRRGTVRFRTYTARGALPVKGAQVIISRPIGGEEHVFYTLTTDMSGQTPIVSLPAPPKELSVTPDSGIAPYAMYNARVTAAGFNDVLIRNMPVFEGILSVQNAALVPSAGMNVPEVIPESEPALNGGA